MAKHRRFTTVRPAFPLPPHASLFRLGATNYPLQESNLRATGRTTGWVTGWTIGQAPSTGGIEGDSR